MCPQSKIMPAGNGIAWEMLQVMFLMNTLQQHVWGDIFMACRCPSLSLSLFEIIPRCLDQPHCPFKPWDINIIQNLTASWKKHCQKSLYLVILFSFLKSIGYPAFPFKVLPSKWINFQIRNECWQRSADISIVILPRLCTPGLEIFFFSFGSKILASILVKHIANPALACSDYVT